MAVICPVNIEFAIIKQVIIVDFDGIFSDRGVKEKKIIAKVRRLEKDIRRWAKSPNLLHHYSVITDDGFSQRSAGR